jgi:hypothetical protein
MMLLRTFQAYPALQAELRRWVPAEDTPSISAPMSLGHRPEFGECAHECVLFPSYSRGAPAELERLVPEEYRQFLRLTNGLFIYCMSFFGWPRPQPTLQCHNLVTANRFWARAYKRLPDGVVHIGSRWHASDENLGYFMSAEGCIYAFTKTGGRITTWANLNDLFLEELPPARELYENGQQQLATIRRQRA